MNKYIKYVIIIGIILIVMYIVKVVFTPSMETQITNYLISKGFEQSDNNLLIKEEDENNKMLFSTADYTLMKNFDEEQNGVNYSLNASYYYKDENVLYSYRITYNDSYNVYYKGEYDGENFTCEKEFSNAKLGTKDNENICNLAEHSIKIFYLDARLLFANNNYLKYMKNH